MQTGERWSQREGVRRDGKRRRMMMMMRRRCVVSSL